MLRFYSKRAFSNSSYSKRIREYSNNLQIIESNKRKRVPNIRPKDSAFSKALANIEPFYDESLEPPEKRVSAYHVSAGFQLTSLRAYLTEKGCRAVQMDNFLLSESSPYFEQHSCSAFFFKNGCAVFWNMSIQTEKKFLEAAQLFDKSYPETAPDHLFLGETEELEVTDTIRNSYIDDNGIHLTISSFRYLDRISFSLALMTTVRLNFLEKKIEHLLQLERHKINSLINKMPTWKLDSLGETIFQSMTALHQLRYELNVEQGLLGMPDSLWDHEEQCNLFSNLQKAFDFRQRIDELNERLSWTFYYFDTFSNYVDEKHSSRLEKIIIVLIMSELLIAIAEAYYNHRENSTLVDQQPK